MATRQLLAMPNISDGFVRLWGLGRADPTVEVLVLCPEYAPRRAEEVKTALKELGPADQVEVE